jgi:hypothetical protein
MGVMSFQVPTDLPAGMIPEVKRAWIIGGPDGMPWPTDVDYEPGQLTIRRNVDDSGCLAVPWDIRGASRLISTTGTLIERRDPYQLQTELARGKVNQLRGQAAEWQAGGLVLPPDLSERIRAASLSFARAASQSPPEQGPLAQAVLESSYATSKNLVDLYVEQMFAARHQRQPRLESTLGCRLGGGPLPAEQSARLTRACNAVCLPLTWSEVEPVEANYQWETYDALLQWAQDQQLAVTAGPLIDFSASRLPDWLWLWERDLTSLASFMCDYVETTLKRYGSQIRTWTLTTASNSAAILGLGEDEFLWLTARVMETARQVDAKLELIVGIAQPWGEYMANDDRTHSPFIFADTLARAGLNLSGLDLEFVMGIWPRGSYCRDLLETSRLIDMYSLLGIPLRVTLGYPSSSEADPLADHELKVAAGQWDDGFTPQEQAKWAAACAALALCKPSVRSVYWIHASDAVPHQFPRCGLFDSSHNPNAVLEPFEYLRYQHLR